MGYDLRVFREKGQKVLLLQQKIPISAAHNPEVVGSSPASATKNRRFHHENGGFPNFLSAKQYGSNLLTHTLTHITIVYSGHSCTNGCFLVTKSSEFEKSSGISL